MSWQLNFENWTGSKKFMDPFLLPSNEYMPTTWGSDTFDFCLHLFYLNEQFQQASQRLISHFITELEFVDEAGDQKEKDNLKSFLRDSLGLFDFLHEIGMEERCYGTAFAWIYFPFDRSLVDDRDGRHSEYSLGIFPTGSYTFDLKTMRYTVPDPRLMHKPESERGTVSLPFLDRKSLDLDRVALRKLDPRFITILPSSCSGDKEYIYRFEPELVNDIQSNKMYEINTTPLAMLEAMSKDEDFIFGSDQVFHMRAPMVSGISKSDWGMPPVLANYRSLHLLQVYRKIDESVGLDYMLPFRIFTPNVAPDKIGDATVMTMLAQWQSHVREMIKKRRSNPFSMHAMPLPTQLLELGANGKELSPKDLIQYQTDNMLDGMGYPAELFRGSMAVQQIPTSIRIFEQSFHFIYSSFNRFVKWVVRKHLDYRNAEQIGVNLMKPSMADDIEKRQAYLQLVAGGEISRQIGYASLGINNPVEVAKARAQEDVEIARAQEKVKKDYEREQTMGSLDQLGQGQEAGGSAAGGAPAGGGGMTPLDNQDRVNQTAQQLLQIPTDGDRAKAMRQLEATDNQLYAMVKDRMEKMRSQAASQGKQQLSQQLQQQQTGQQ